MHVTGKAVWTRVGLTGAIIASVAYLIACGAALAANQFVDKHGPVVYNPHTKSYFQLFRDNVHGGGRWANALDRAKTKYYKGIAGRLAHVEDPETHQFLVENLGLRHEREPIWIGLRYWCSLKMLQWTSDRAFSPSDADRFRMWHTYWSAQGPNSSACDLSASYGRRGFAPVYYTTINGVTRWQATGAAKFYDRYVVEYLTGGE